MTPIGDSPFTPLDIKPLDPVKFRDPLVTAKGEMRASVAMTGLDTLWFNTGTLCNLACKNCYIESSPKNDALVYMSPAEIADYLAEISFLKLDTREIGLTGGEPFMNPDIIAILELCLTRRFDVLVLSNAMRPMRRHEQALLDLRQRFGDQMTIRVSLDHYSQQVHEAERGPNSWDKAISGLRWLAENGFSIAIAGRHLADESDAEARSGYDALFSEHGIPVDSQDLARLVLFPEMEADADIAEITTACWGILDIDPASIMCANSRMVVKHRGAAAPTVAACTLLPYDPQFDLGPTLHGAMQDVQLNHPHCARFCVLGGASCAA